MKAQETTLQEILEGKKQYQVPLFQRVYSWGHDQIDQLWSDVADIADDRKKDPAATHFIGSLVLATSPGNGPVGPQRFLVIDGQQRLTTLSLLLAAIRDSKATNGEIEAADGIDKQYLINPYDAGQPLKFLPTQADRDAYNLVIRGSHVSQDNSNVITAYRMFIDKLAQLNEEDNDLTIDEVEYAILNGLGLVSVTAQSGDNAHRIFESLNNTGLSLTQADLLKNYLFMRLESRSESVYETVWLPLENLLGPKNLELLFWLDLVQDDERAKQSETYLGQQRRLDKLRTPEEIEIELRRIANLGILLASILDPEREDDPELRHRLKRIQLWGTTTAYPVVLQILHRRDIGAISAKEASDALLILESYFVRRIIIGRATANLNRTLAQATAVVARAESVVDGLRDFLSSGRKYFGSNRQIQEAVKSVDFYNQGKAAQRKLILQWIEESYQSKEPINPTTLTIEHVMPQTLSAAWRKDLKPQLPSDIELDVGHSSWVHTIGNLTLTGYNSEMSNSRFEVKREHFLASGLRMNQDIAQQDVWGPHEIESRAEQLSVLITSIWPGPNESITPASVTSVSIEQEALSERFESQIRSQQSPETVAAVSGLIDYWTSRGGWLSFGDGNTTSAFFVTTGPTGSIWPITLYPDGKVEIVFQYLASRRPFDNEALRHELRLRLNRVPEVYLPDRPRPGFKPELLAKPDTYHSLIDVLDWFLMQLHGSLGETTVE